MTKTRHRPQRWWRSALYLCLSSALLLEIVLRLWVQFPSDAPLFVSDPQVGFRYRPHSEFGRRLTNSRGFNDVEVPRERPAGMRRIAVLGDSFVFGVVAPRENMVSAFDRLVNANGKRFEVLNMGIPAAGPENYLGVLEHDALEWQAEVIFVVFFVGNDVF